MDKRRYNEKTVFRTDFIIDDFVGLMRSIERESGFPNVDDETTLEMMRLRAFEKLLLIGTEISEAVERLRDHDFQSLNLREEFADIFIRWAATCAGLGFTMPMAAFEDLSPDEQERWEQLGLTTGTIEDLVRCKAAFNTTRPPKHGRQA